MFTLYFHLDANIGSKKSHRKYVVVNLCHAREHKPTSVLLVSTMWCDGGENVGTIDMYEKTLELEEFF